MSGSIAQGALSNAKVFADTRAAQPSRSWSRVVALDLIAIMDAVCVVAGGLIPALFYNVSGGEQINLSSVLQAGLCAALIVVLCLKAWDMYDSAKLHDLPDHPVWLLAAVLLSVASVFTFALPPFLTALQVWIWVLCWTLGSFSALVLHRLLTRNTMQKLVASGRFDQRVAVFGAGPIAVRVCQSLQDSTTGVHFVGTFEDRAPERCPKSGGLQAMGKLSDLLDAARNDQVDRIVIALPQSAEERIRGIVKTLEQLPVTIHIATHISSDIVGPAQAHAVSHLGPVGLLDVKTKPLADWAPLVKRAEDVVVSTAILLMAAPVLPLIALAIKISSPGPILFRQNRRGLNKRVFEVLKFRTMTVAENGDVVNQAKRQDARVTTIGWFLRRTSLDELPQLFNVLWGDMSLVGPRPHAIVHDDQFDEMLEEYANRHQVKPGITGLAQVNGCRGETDTAEKVKARVDFDIAYIKSWSLWHDLKIICQTVLAVISTKNAY